jgi:PAS domain S-box-containing protein
LSADVPNPSYDELLNAQRLVEQLPVALYVCEAPSGRITFYNARAAELWGRKPRHGEADERFCGSFKLWHLSGAPLRHDETPMAQALLEGRRTRNQEVIIERPDGSLITVLVNIDPVFDRAGRVVGAINVFQDATTLKKTADARARLAAIVESSDDAIISADLKGTITSWNRGAERLYGYTASEAVHQPVTMLIPPERHDEGPGLLERVRRGERIDHYETVRRHKDGSFLDISLTVSPLVDDHGHVIGVSKISRDITEQKQVAARIEMDREVMSRLYEIGKLCTRPEDHFTDTLQQMLATGMWICGAEKGNIQLLDETSSSLKIVVQRGFDAEFLDFFASVEQSDASVCGAAFAFGERIVVEDVTTSDIFAGHTSQKVLLDAGVRSVQSTPFISSKGKILGMLSTHHSRPGRPTDRECRLLDVLARQAADYVERKRAEEQREELLRGAERSREEAEAANRAKDEFLAMLGHELRNPLSSIRNAIAAATLDESSRERALSIACRATDQLGRLVDDLLDVARITRGRVPLRKELVSLGAVLQRTVDGAQGLMAERGHSLSLLLPAEEIRLEADAARIEQAVTNLLTNAAKYTDPGGTVTVSAERDHEQAVIRVRDNGIGIPPEVLPRVFDLFTQAERSLDRAQGGLGIGLTLVRRIVELHGGTVEAKSLGAARGSEFIIRLPARPWVATEVTPTPKSRRAGSERRPARVLMVEDNPEAAESLMMILELLGHQARVVHDGRTAIDAARANLPDVMLIDIGLPGMNGYEVAQAIRRDATLKHLVLVALTGYGLSEDKARAMAAGFDHHLVKPVDLDALQELVERVGMRAKKGSSAGHDVQH